jgi:hypothetical protein
MPQKNTLLSDVCISTSAAPTYLPAHCFQTRDGRGAECEYNLINGGVVANNPMMVAMMLVTKTLVAKEKDDHLPPVKPMHCGWFLVLCIKMSSVFEEHDTYTAWQCLQW